MRQLQANIPPHVPGGICNLLLAFTSDVVLVMRPYPCRVDSPYSPPSVIFLTLWELEHVMDAANAGCLRSACRPLETTYSRHGIEG